MVDRRRRLSLVVGLVRPVQAARHRSGPLPRGFFLFIASTCDCRSCGV